MISFIVWDIDPVIFEEFTLFRWYGVCWVVGLLLGYQVMLTIYSREGRSRSDLDKLVGYVMVGVIIGARLGHVLFYDPGYYFSHPIEILPIRLEPTFQFTGLAGLASHGGVLGALVAIALYRQKYKIAYLYLLDRMMIAGSFLGCFIRIGNFVNSEIVGLPAHLPWSVVFVRVDTVPRHPAQLYEALFYLLIGVILFSIWRSGRMTSYKGFLLGLGLSLNFLQRFLVEFLKENQVSFEDQLLLNMGQLLSIPLAMTGVFIMVWSIRRHREDQHHFTG